MIAPPLIPYFLFVSALNVIQHHFIFPTSLSVKPQIRVFELENFWRHWSHQSFRRI